MRFLFVDDTPESIKPLVSTVRAGGHQAVIASDLLVAWRHVAGAQAFDLVVIDIALARYVRDFADEQALIAERLAAKGYGDLPMSGQALGLRLWRKRAGLRLPYCYATNHRQLWLPGLDTPDCEFRAAETAILPETIIDKSSLWQHNVQQRLDAVLALWQEQHWLAGRDD